MMERLSSIDELAVWIGGMNDQGAVRFELWQKPRGGSQRLVLELTGDAIDAADEAYARVQKDERSIEGTVTYAILGYRDNENQAFVKAIVVSGRGVLAIPMQGAITQPAAHALTELVNGLQNINAGAFAAMLRENEHQRRNNEAIFKAKNGHCEEMARGYERALAAMQLRLDAALAETKELRETEAQLNESMHAVLGVAQEAEKTNAKDLLELHRQKVKDQFLQNTINLLSPIVIAKVTKQSLADSPLGLQMLKEFVLSLTKEQTKVIVGCLTHGQAIAFTSFVDDLKAQPFSSQSGSPNPQNEQHTTDPS